MEEGQEEVLEELAKYWEELGRRQESGIITEEDGIETTGVHAVRHL